MPDDFLHRDLPRVQKRVHRLGLAGNFGLDSRGVAAAIERGLQYMYWTPRVKGMTAPLREALRRDRERLVVATGPTTGFLAGGLRRFVEGALKTLDTDYLDVLQLHWLGKTAAWTPRIADAMVALREEGKVRAIGTSIHDRKRAGQLAADSPLDLFMIRYNAAHPGAERDIFPHLAARQPAVVSYTATAWRRLLKAPKGWDGPPMSAGDCYRFALSSPHVHVTLCGPASVEQLDENLAALERGPLDSQEMDRIRAFGERVHATGGAVSALGWGG